MTPEFVTVDDWLAALDAESAGLPGTEWNFERLRRQHGLQICMDVIAHVQNIPLRLVRWNQIRSLDKTFVSFVTKWESQILSILTDEGHALGSKPSLSVSEAKHLIEQMRDPLHVATLRDWVLGMPAGVVPRPDLPEHYETWFIELLPHLERDVWLTDLSNPMQVHSLTRMVEHCALYELMWAWKYFGDMPKGRGNHGLSPVFGFSELGLTPQYAFSRRGRTTSQNPAVDDEQPIVMLGGPFELEKYPPRHLDAAREESAWFADGMFAFLRGASAVKAWSDVWAKAPTATELDDALATRLPLSMEEAARRVEQAVESLHLLLESRIDRSVTLRRNGATGRPISRANWESIAALTTWQHRWGKTLRECEATRPLLVRIPNHRVSLVVRSSPTGGTDQHTFIAYDESASSGVDLGDFVAAEIVVLRSRNADRWIELPQTLLARARERQHAAWASHVIAINNLLTRHSRRDRPVGTDRTDDGATIPTPNSDEADHMLRGYAGRICRYLLQLARADIAVIYWMDYSVDPPQLRHVGDADRLVQHRAERRSRLRAFSEWALAPGADGVPPAQAGHESPSQFYRCAARAIIDPTRAERVAREDGPFQVVFKSDNYADPKPLDCLAVPLLFAERVVGVVGLESVGSIREFDARLHAPLRRVAQLLAQAMYFQSQIWHMRRINWLASHRPLEQWRRHDSENHYNPLRAVAHNLANIFLCPVVNIWLQDPANPERYKLHGYTREALFRPSGRILPSAPLTRINLDLQSGPLDLSYPFIALAIAQWRNGHATQERPVGHFVQAHFDPDLESTRPEYTLEAAKRGDLTFGQDFADAWRDIDIGGPDPRRRMFEQQKLTQVMAFALVDTSAPVPDPVGIVTLHSPATSSNGEHPPWSPGWWPVVANVQTYLLYVLMQTETIANPLENLRRYLLHEGRNELNGVAIMVSDLRAAMNRLLAPDRPPGRFRPWLRKQLPDLNRRAKALATGGDNAWLTDVVDELSAAERQLEETWKRVIPLLRPERAENFGILARLIEVQRDLASISTDRIDPEYDHEASWTGLRDELNAAFLNYDSVWKGAGIWVDLDEVTPRSELLTSAVLFRWMLNDLVHNVAKYALANTVVTLTLSRDPADRDLYRFGFKNVSSYDPERDHESKLQLHGVQGSAGLNPPRVLPINAQISRKGTGIGVWGVSVLAKVLSMELQINVEPMSDSRGRPDRATYTFELVIPSRLLRRT